MVETGVDQSWLMFMAQFDVLLVNRATVERGVDQFALIRLLVLLVKRATVDKGVDQSWNTLAAQLLVLLVNWATVEMTTVLAPPPPRTQFDVLLVYCATVERETGFTSWDMNQLLVLLVKAATLLRPATFCRPDPSPMKAPPTICCEFKKPIVAAVIWVPPRTDQTPTWPAYSWAISKAFV